MDSFQNQKRTKARIASACLFPQSAKTLIQQAKSFTGIDIVMDPHWHAAPSLWAGGESESKYRAWVQNIQNEGERSAEAFVFYNSGKGAYIVYADYGNRWDQSLCPKDPSQRSKVNALCHEIGHLLVGVDSKNLDHRDHVFLNEQSAILAGSMLQTITGESFVFNMKFPLIGKFTPEKIRAQMQYDLFSAYTPSPLAYYYMSQQGVFFGRQRYLSQKGAVRMDLVAQDVAESHLHFRHHLSCLHFFGAIGERIATDPSYAPTLLKGVGRSVAQLSCIADSCKSDYAASVMKQWWHATQELMGWKGVEEFSNLYCGDALNMPSIHHAKSYHTNMAMKLHYALARRPGDKFLSDVYQGVTRALDKPALLPKIKQTVVAYSEDMPLAKPPTQARRGILKRIKDFICA